MENPRLYLWNYIKAQLLISQQKLTTSPISLYLKIYCFYFLFSYAHVQEVPKKKKTVMKIQRWEEKLFSIFVDQKDSVTNKRLIEAQLVYFYQHIDTQDLFTAGGILDIEDGYLLLSDLGLRALFSVYCAKGKDFDLFSKMK
jgi:hypothetical protein